MANTIPKQVIIEVTNRCNLQCKFCPSITNDGKFPVGDMSLGLFKSIVDRIAIEFPGSTVIPWMNGEPFLHPQYLEMIRHLNAKGLRFYVTTNLTQWHPDIIAELLRSDSNCYQLIVSIDGLPGSGSIAKARPGTDEDALLANMRRLLAMHRDMGSKTDVAVKICERGQDWGEIEDYIQYWLEIPEISYACVGKPLKDVNESSMRQDPCQYFDNNFMVIRHTGDLVVCAYNDACANGLAHSYGVVTMDNSLRQLYNNRFITALRDEQNVGRFHGPCQACGFAYTGQGFNGRIAFRSDPGRQYYFQQDYYNSFFSKTRDWKPNSYYGGLDLQEEPDGN